MLESSFNGLGFRRSPGSGQQLDEQPSQTNRFGRQIVSRECRTRGRRIAFVEHQLNHAKDRIESVRQLDARRHFIRNPRVANLGLRSDDALRQPRRRRQKRLGDLLGCQAAHLAKREGDLGIPRQRRMAAREDQPEPIVLDGLLVRPSRRIMDGNIGFVPDLVERVEARAAAGCLSP